MSGQGIMCETQIKPCPDKRYIVVLKEVFKGIFKRIFKDGSKESLKEHLKRY
jgi:hypothetical protein